MSGSDYTLTRFLYIKDEVELSFVTALLKKKNLQECYYWVFELYYSGFHSEVFQLLWKIYFDFYYEYNPTMEFYILKKQTLWQEEKKDIIIASIVRNLFRLKSSPNVFILRQYMLSSNTNTILPTVIYRNKKPAWLSAYPELFHNFLMSLKRGHVANICQELLLLAGAGAGTTGAGTDMNNMNNMNMNNMNNMNMNTICEVNTIREVVVRFVKSHFTDTELDLFEKKWTMRMYTNDLHYLLAFISYLQVPTRDVNKCSIFVTPRDEDMDFIHKVEYEAIPLIYKRGVVIEQIYNTLRFKRYFKINETIGAFKLARWKDNNKDNYNDFLKKNWFHWEYYAARGCPLWRARVDECAGVLDHETSSIVFPTENKKDKFYDSYAYEFDEQPKDIQMMSHCDIKKEKWQDWYFELFNDMTVGIILNNDFEFMNY